MIERQTDRTDGWMYSYFLADYSFDWPVKNQHQQQKENTKQQHSNTMATTHNTMLFTAATNKEVKQRAD